MLATDLGMRPRRNSKTIEVDPIRILVTGKRGQLAQALAQISCDVFVVAALGRPQFDITRRSSVKDAIRHLRPDVIVNSAAYTAVDRAEEQPGLAFAVNRDGARNIAAEAAELDIPIIHLSTDYVFSGTDPIPYVETDAPSPLNVYGLSKLAGENLVRQENPRHIILRTSWLYSPWGQNFLLTMLKLGCEKDYVRVVNDQFGAPTYVPDLATAIVAVICQVLARAKTEDCWGTFHLTAAGVTSWADFAKAIFETSGAYDGPSAQVVPVPTAAYPTKTRRPAYSVLDGSKFRQTFGVTMPHWRDGLDRCVAQVMGDAAISRSAGSWPISI